jgi:hypothetical protein
MWTVFNHTNQDGSRELGIMKKGKMGNQPVRKVMLRLGKDQRATEGQLRKLADAATEENVKAAKSKSQKRRIKIQGDGRTPSEGKTV